MFFCNTKYELCKYWLCLVLCACTVYWCSAVVKAVVSLIPPSAGVPVCVQRCYCSGEGCCGVGMRCLSVFNQWHSAARLDREAWLCLSSWCLSSSSSSSPLSARWWCQILPTASATARKPWLQHDFTHLFSRLFMFWLFVLHGAQIVVMIILVRYSVEMGFCPLTS